MNASNLLSNITGQDIAILFIVFLLGILVSYLWMLGKQKKENIDKKKLESYMKGINYIIEDETDKAIKELTDTAKLDPDMIDIYLSIGNLFRKKGEINRALIIHKSLLARANLEKDKKMDIYLNIGIDYKKAGLYDRAKKYFKDALSIDPKNNQAKRLLYEVYEDSKDWENALIWHKRFDGVDKHTVAHLYTELGKDNLKEGKTEEAKKNFERALKEYKNCIDALLHLGDIYFQYGKIEKAYQLWERVCLIQPQFCNLALNRIQDDSVLTEKLINLLMHYPDNPYILFFAAESFLKLQQKKKASSLYKALLKKGIKSPFILKRLSEIETEKTPGFLKIFTTQNITYPIRYTCTNCGHSAGKLFFRCPKCKSWDKIRVDIV
ncbi:tetratricopeptide repeat protein [Hippea sp. KM1]|uniref:tetratricopeptide repeat protein n=1 Tax=Hippea sp. KM1 TaxID=944481 RepID=UPI00046CA031|nr:tetratricopeptide repeat protein [Hippea sp. KM1]